MTPSDGAPGPADPGDPAVARVERALVRLRRSIGRRELGRRVARELGEPLDLALLGVLDAVEQGPDGGEPGVTVGAVAARLGLDPSRGSRLVASAVGAGYVRRSASQRDGRRSVLALTAEGERLAAAVGTLRRAVFAEAMRGWTPAEREEFARLLARFTGEEAPPEG